MGTYPDNRVCPKCHQQGTLKTMNGQGMQWTQCINCPYETVMRVDVARVE